MERQRTNVEQTIIYPNKETMKMFVEIGKKLNIFEESISSKNNTNIYSNVSVVHALAILIEKINTEGNEHMKNEFKSVLETGDNDKIFRFIANAVLDVWLEKHNCQFVRDTVKADKQRIETIAKFSRDDIVPIPYSYLPERYGETSSTNLIHEKFEAEISRLEEINKGADQIQQEMENHTFDRGNNEGKIKDLEDRL